MGNAIGLLLESVIMNSKGLLDCKPESSFAVSDMTLLISSGEEVSILMERKFGFSEEYFSEIGVIVICSSSGGIVSFSGAISSFSSTGVPFVEKRLFFQA